VFYLSYTHAAAENSGSNEPSKTSFSPKRSADSEMRNEKMSQKINLGTHAESAREFAVCVEPEPFGRAGHKFELLNRKESSRMCFHCAGSFG
jgi:hypothetical protein